jgi:Tfp pilus assembly protein PilX
MNAMTRSREGLALPMVLGAIVLIGTMIAGVMYFATQDYRVGANALNETRAESAAEMGLNRLTTDWDQSKNTTMAVGNIRVSGNVTVNGNDANPSGWACS